MEKVLMKASVWILKIELFFFMGIVYAHDTTHTHPLITNEIASLIEKSDITSGAYKDIYIELPNISQRKYWGTDFDQTLFPENGTEAEQDAHLLELDATPYTRYNNVIDGVVHEDMPATKVFKHFYHAESGAGFSLKDATFDLGPYQNSAITAMSYFNQSITWMGGYETLEAVDTGGLGVNVTGKEYAFFMFGQALHHVEDMSSPAHIHNDSHLVVFSDEKDDYEGWYVPFLKKSYGATLGALFNTPTTENEAKGAIKAVNNPWYDIWNNQASSMVKYFYDRTVYRETLHFPLDTPGVLNPNEFEKPNPPPDPIGELHGMFPCVNDSGSAIPNCLFWNEEDLYTYSHWEINPVGNYQHQYVVGRSNDWWPVDVENDNSPVSSSDPRDFNGVSARYYIEQLSNGNSDTNISGDPVIPTKMRTYFNLPWNGSSTGNAKELRQIYAENMLSPAIGFGAGFVKYWYDIANTPPYLASILVTQSLETVYSSSWIDNVNNVNVFNAITDVVNCSYWEISCLYLQGVISVVDSRTHDIQLDKISHIDDNQDIIIELAFNEPIKQITQLLIGKHDVNGVCIEPVSGCSDITPPPLDGNGVPPANSGVVLSEATDADGDTVWRWEITVDKSKLNNLNGKLQLTVKAIDYNNHRDGQGGTTGGGLDGTPNTPAKRNTDYAVATLSTVNPTNHYPWYQEGVANETPNDIAYSYDYADGDQNHVLVFDTSAPSTTINVDLTLQ